MIFYYVYLIQSIKDSIYYIGYSDNLNQRLKEHNQGKTKSIKHKVPFKLIYFEGYLNKTTARKREIRLKKNSFEKEKLLKRLQGI